MGCSGPPPSIPRQDKIGVAAPHPRLPRRGIKTKTGLLAQAPVHRDPRRCPGMAPFLKPPERRFLKGGGGEAASPHPPARRWAEAVAREWGLLRRCSAPAQRGRRLLRQGSRPGRPGRAPSPAPRGLRRRPPRQGRLRAGSAAPLASAPPAKVSPCPVPSPPPPTRHLSRLQNAVRVFERQRRG